MTSKQKAFCKHYIACKFNASEAARRAGYSPHRVNVTSSQLLANPNIQSELDRLVKKEFSMLDRQALMMFKTIAHACQFDLRSAVSWGPSGVILKDSDSLEQMDALMISEVSETITKDGGSQKIKTISKERAWEMMAKITNLLDTDKLIVKGESNDKKTNKDTKERIAFLLDKRGVSDRS